MKKNIKYSPSTLLDIKMPISGEYFSWTLRFGFSLVYTIHNKSSRFLSIKKNCRRFNQLQVSNFIKCVWHIDEVSNFPWNIEVLNVTTWTKVGWVGGTVTGLISAVVQTLQKLWIVKIAQITLLWLINFYLSKELRLLVLAFLRVIPKFFIYINQHNKTG